MTSSSIYRGIVTHRRLTPIVSALAYRVFLVHVDLDEAQALSDHSRVFGFNRPRLLSLYERDHGDGSQRPLKAQIEAMAAQAGFATGGPVRIMTMPRVLGCAFNPLTVFFCHGPDGRLKCTVHEVNSIFGGRHFYTLPAGKAVFRQMAVKRMAVSPFMDMDHTYHFRVREPAARFDLALEVRRGERVFLATGFAGVRSDFTDRDLMRAWLADPVASWKVIAGIRWEMLKLRLKGVPVMQQRGGGRPDGGER